MTIEGQASNIGATAFAVSNIETQKQMVQKIRIIILIIYITLFQFNGLKDAKTQLAKGNKALPINKVEVRFILRRIMRRISVLFQNLMDDLDDQLLDQEEMNDLFSRPIGQESSMTDADLENGKK